VAAVIISSLFNYLPPKKWRHRICHIETRCIPSIVHSKKVHWISKGNHGFIITEIVLLFIQFARD